MSIWIQASLMFAFSASNDWLNVMWHETRERGQPIRAAIVGVLMGVIAWIAIYWVVTESVWLILADLAGTAAGSYWGVKNEMTSKRMGTSMSQVVLEIVRKSARLGKK